MARPRLTVRRLMLIVASAGLLLGVATALHRRRAWCLAKVDECDRGLAFADATMGGLGPEQTLRIAFEAEAERQGIFRSEEEIAEMIAATRRRDERLRRSRERYARVARFPFLPVGPDPAEPR